MKLLVLLAPLLVSAPAFAASGPGFFKAAFSCFSQLNAYSNAGSHSWVDAPSPELLVLPKQRHGFLKGTLVYTELGATLLAESNIQGATAVSPSRATYHFKARLHEGSSPVSITINLADASVYAFGRATVGGPSPSAEESRPDEVLPLFTERDEPELRKKLVTELSRIASGVSDAFVLRDRVAQSTRPDRSDYLRALSACKTTLGGDRAEFAPLLAVLDRQALLLAGKPAPEAPDSIRSAPGAH